MPSVTVLKPAPSSCPRALLARSSLHQRHPRLALPRRFVPSRQSFFFLANICFFRTPSLLPRLKLLLRSLPRKHLSRRPLPPLLRRRPRLLTRRPLLLKQLQQRRRWRANPKRLSPKRRRLQPSAQQPARFVVLYAKQPYPLIYRSSVNY